MAFDIENIKSLITVAAQAQVDELEFSHNGVDVRIQRCAGPVGDFLPLHEPVAVAAQPALVHTDAPAGAGAVSAAAELPLHMVKAAMAGTFYRCVTPGGQVLVNEGDSVDVGTVLGVLESMKMMNEIESEHRGRIRRILCSDGELVSTGQPLFELEEAGPC